MDFLHLKISTALLAGIASFFSPCIIPVLPGFFAFLGGTSEKAKTSRWRILGQTLLFSLGFGLIFSLLGVGAYFLGKPLTVHRVLFERTGGILLIVFGLLLSGVLPAIPMIQTSKAIRFITSSAHGIRSFLLGIIFSFAWIPCIGPILGTILYLATGAETATRGGILLLFFSLGMAIPFLVLSFFVPELTKVLRKFSLFSRYSHYIIAAIFILLGILLLSGKLGIYSGWLLEKFGMGFVF